MKTPKQMYTDAIQEYADIAMKGHYSVNKDTAAAFVLGFAKGGEYVAAIVQKEVGIQATANHITAEFMDKIMGEMK